MANGQMTDLAFNPVRLNTWHKAKGQQRVAEDSIAGGRKLSYKFVRRLKKPRTSLVRLASIFTTAMLKLETMRPRMPAGDIVLPQRLHRAT